jgi:histidine ammonia-lyase
MHLQLSHDDLTLEQVGLVLSSQVTELSVAAEAMLAVQRSYTYIQGKIEDDTSLYYGINTGFGSLCDVSIPKSDIQQLQLNLLRSHACGAGEEVPYPLVRLMLVLKIKNLIAGHSGVSVTLVEQLLSLYNNDITPLIYQLGSLGASGDLAPLAHLALPAVGEGRVRYKGLEMAAADALHIAGIEAHVLQAKEGLALINGTQFSAAYMSYAVLQSHRMIEMATNYAAVSIEAYACDHSPYEVYTHEVRRHSGQIEIAKQVYAWISTSKIRSACSSVQDPYAFRCVPQVHGASLTAVEHARAIILQEINAVTDNPNIFAEDDRIISGGNFHAQPLAMVLDYMALAIAELGSISERRIYKLINGDRDLPAYLADNPGLESGYMIAQYTAASIVSQNKQWCTPASIDSIVSSKGQEDHVSMAANAATKCYRIIDNVWQVLAIELMIAVRAIEYRAPLRPSPSTQRLVDKYRATIPRVKGDHIIHDHMQAALAFVRAEV